MVWWISPPCCRCHNVGMVQAMRRLDDDVYWNWMERLGINQRPDTDLP